MASLSVGAVRKETLRNYYFSPRIHERFRLAAGNEMSTKSPFVDQSFANMDMTELAKSHSLIKTENMNCFSDAVKSTKKRII